MAKFLRIFTISGLFLIPLIPVIVAGGESFTAFFFPDLLFPFITGKNFAFRIIIEIKIGISVLFLIRLIPVIVAGGESFAGFFFPDLLFPFITGKNFAFRIIIEIIFASWILLALLEPKYRPKKTLILW